LKMPVTELGEIHEIFKLLKGLTDSEIKKRGIRIRNREIVSAYMASALIGMSRKVERIKDAVNTWLMVREALQVHEDEDMISVILATGHLRDLDATHMIKPDPINEIVMKIKDKVAKTG